MAEHFEAWSSCFNLSVVAWLHLTSLKGGNAWCYVLPFLCLRNSVLSSVTSFHYSFKGSLCTFTFSFKKMRLFFLQLCCRLAPRQRHGTPDPASPAPVVSAQQGAPDSGTILHKQNRKFSFWDHRISQMSFFCGCGDSGLDVV